MANKKEEHDILLELSEKDLWCQDLDAFAQEWKQQLKEDAEYEKDIRSKGRRASRKIGAGRNVKGRSRADDDDFNPSKSKAATKSNLQKGVIKVEQKPHKGFLEMFQAKPKPKPAPGLGSDGAEEKELSGMSDDDFAALGAAGPSRQTSRAPSEQPGPANGRSKRAAAAAPKMWIEEFDEESESDDGKFLEDVGDMVKGISGGESSSAGAKNGRLSLFAMSRPGTSHGDRPTSSSGLPKHTLKTKASRAFDLSDQDETNYEMLAKSSPHKPAPISKNTLDSFLSDDDAPVPLAKPSGKPATTKAPVKRAPKPKPAPVAKKAAPAPPAPAQTKPKPITLSPAAKAYAAKQSKVQAAVKNVFSDDEDAEMEDIEPSPAKPAARGRPARAAVAKAKKPIYINSDDEDDDDDISAVVEDEESEDDFDSD